MSVRPRSPAGWPNSRSAPFIKVEATKFTEVGYVGRDVEQMIRDLIEADPPVSCEHPTNARTYEAAAHLNAEERVLLMPWLGEGASSAETRESFRKLRNAGEIDDKEIEVQVADSSARACRPSIYPACPGLASRHDQSERHARQGVRRPGAKRKRRVTVRHSYEMLIAEESDKLLDEEKVIQPTRSIWSENNGIVFLDEIDKICARSRASGRRRQP